jgi:hypothetical protein
MVRVILAFRHDLLGALLGLLPQVRVLETNIFIFASCLAT